MMYYLPKFKRDHLKDEIDNILSQAREKQPIQTLEMAKILGKIVSCVRALGQTIKIFLRSSQYALDRQVLQQGWDSVFTIPSNVAEEVLFVRDNIDSKNGQPIINSRTGITLNEFIQGTYHEHFTHRFCNINIASNQVF